MSKAFTREDLPEAAPIVIKRAQLPEGVPNYVTPLGLELLRREREELLETRRAAIAASDHGALPNIDANLEVLNRKSTRLNSSHVRTSYAVFCLKKKTRPRIRVGRP